MMVWSLEAFYESVARNGLDGIAAIETDTLVTTGDDLEMDANGVVAWATLVTAAIANVVDWRFHRTLDPNWFRSNVFVRDQTGAIDYGKLGFAGYPFSEGDVLNAEADNGNNAQVEALLLALGYPSAQFLLAPPTLPPGARWVDVTGGTAAVAGTWTKSTATFNETFNRGQKYQVLGMIGYSATGYAMRLHHRGPKGNPWIEHRPGVPAGDTVLLCQPLYGDFGWFQGDKPPNLEVLCSGADGAQYASLLIL